MSVIQFPPPSKSFPTQPSSATVKPSRAAKHGKRGPCLNRRTGQSGTVYQRKGSTWNPNDFAYGKFWEDTKSGERLHRTINLGRCRTKTIAKQQLRAYLAEHKVNDVETFHRILDPELTFGEQAGMWMESLRIRRRRPAKGATLESYRNCLKRLLSLLEDMPLSQVGNSALKMVMDHMSAERQASGKPLSAKTIVMHATVLKQVVSSAVNAEGEPLFPRKWNDEFAGVPIIDKNKQRRDTVTADEVTSLVAGSKGRYRVLFATLAGAGPRIGEALALKPEDFSSDCRVIHITHGIWKGKDQSPKTQAAVRDIDIPEELAAELREYLQSIPAGKYLFATARGKPVSQSQALKVLHRHRRIGFHAFRRFRSSVLRKARVPGDLEKLWLGHALRTVTDDYVRQLREDLAYRQEWAERTTLGFSMAKPRNVLQCSTSGVATRNSAAA